MRFYRFIQNNIPETQESITLERDQQKHLQKVLRMSAGDEVELIDGNGTLANGIIQNDLSITIISKTIAPPKNSSITVYMSILKHGGNDDTIRKLSEIGIEKIIPVIADRSNAKWNAERAERIVLEALKQCGSLYKTQITAPILFKDISPSKESNSQHRRFILSQFAKIDIGKVVLEKNSNIELLIGPEGGFTENEFKIAEEKNFEAITLKTNILRAETASIYAVSALHSKLVTE